MLRSKDVSWLEAQFNIVRLVQSLRSRDVSRRVLPQSNQSRLVQLLTSKEVSGLKSQDNVVKLFKSLTSNFVIFSKLRFNLSNA